MPILTMPLVLLLAMPVASAGDVAGHYYLQNVREMGSELLLKPDGTFEWMLAYGAADYHASGTWRAEGGSVILNTSTREAPPFRLTRSAATKEAGTRVWVLAPNGRPVAHIEVALESAGGTARERTADDGCAVFPTLRQARRAAFHVPVYDVDAGPFDLDPKHDSFYFEINGEAITEVRFRDEKLAIEDGALIMRRFDPEHPMRYEKQ